MSPDSERGEGWWKATVTWPMADVPNDFYAIRADLSAAGEDTFGWSHAFVAAVFGVPEPGDDLTTNTDALGSDVGSLTDPNDPVPVPSPAVGNASPQQSGCRSGPQGASHLGFFLLGLTLLWYLRARRISAESYLESSMDDCSIQARGVR